MINIMFFDQPRPPKKSFQDDKEPTNYALMAYASPGSSNSTESDNEVAPYSRYCSKTYATFQTHYDNLTIELKKSQLDVLSYKIENDRYKTGEGYHDVPPLYTRTFLPTKLDLVFTDDPNASESVANMFTVESSINKPSKDMSKTHRAEALLLRIRSLTLKMKLRLSLPVPIAVTQSTVKCTWPVKHVVNKAHSHVRSPINQITTTKNSNFNKKVTTVKVNKVNAIQGNKGNADKASAYWVWKPKCKVLDHVSRLTSASMALKKFDNTDALGRSKSVMAWVPKKTLSFLLNVQGNPQQALKDKGVIDSGCSRHMTGNISFLSDFEEINGG
nr:hypothetical protein [Tanacetum cinerariifolium]